MTRGCARVVVVWAWILVGPSALFAQENASIAGVVKDTSGAVLPGVTVEAASPALIEKTRSVVTDATGQYKVVNLRSGIYSVTFTLPGFSTVKREGIELTGSFVATVNGELKVGALEETITVTGETPVVDVQTAKTQAVLNTDVLAAIPTARNYQNLHVLVPGVTIASGNQDVGGAAGDVQVSFSAHGGDAKDSHTLVNGLSVNGSGGGRTQYVPSAGSSQEVTITTSGGLGEAETAGVTVNMVYKDGGNSFKGTAFGTGAAGSMVSSNYDQALKDQGLRAPNTVKNVYDYEGTFGGPIFKDKLWFFGQARYHGNANYIAGMFANKNAGDITKWTYDPDLSQQAVLDSRWTDESLRLTWQITPRNKLAVYYEDQLRCVACNGGATSTSAPEAAARQTTHPSGIEQLTWTSPFSNRVLLEAGVGILPERWGNEPRADFNPALIQVTAQNVNSGIAGLTYRAPGSLSKPWYATYSTRASLTYTSGAHSMKFGYTGEASNSETSNDRRGNPFSYRLTTSDPGGVPNQLTEFAWPYYYYSRFNAWGLYAQDQWTRNRMTLAGGLRYDRFRASFPDATLHATLVPTPVLVPGRETTGLSDISTRMSAAYDVFGDGKTAVKLSFGKYLLSESNSALPLGGQAAPMAGIPSSFSRSWTDSNRNFIPDCDLLNLQAQDLTASGGDVCGVANNLNFGTLVSSAAQQDPAVFYGWGNRPYNYEFDATVQRELLPRVSASVTYFRRWFGNFIVTQNRAVAPSNYTVFNLPIPNDPRLPVSGGTVQVQDLNPTGCGRPTGCFGVVDNYVTSAANFGNQYQHWNGVDFAVNARLQALLLQGGISTGRQSADNCDVVAKVPNLLFTGSLTSVTAPTTTNAPTQYCHVVEPLQTQVKLIGSYTIPRIDVQAAATLQNIPGQEIQATYAVPNAVARAILGRDLAGSVANTSVNLLPPSTYYAARVNQLDFRAAKIVRFSGKRAQVALDLYNALNSNVIETYNNAYSPTGTWRVPTLILPARVAKISAQIDF